MRAFLLISFSMVISGCATLLSGYESEVIIHNCSDSLRVFTSEGVELTKSFNVTTSNAHQSGDVTYLVAGIDSTSCSVDLRSNKDYVLLLRDGNRTYHYPAYAKLNVWWFTLDMICGGFPVVVDAITGCWNYYDPIYLKKKTAGAE